MGASVNHAKYEHKEINMSANHIWFQLYIFNNCFIYSTMYREQLSATQRILKNVNLEKLQKIHINMRNLDITSKSRIITQVKSCLAVIHILVCCSVKKYYL